MTDDTTIQWPPRMAALRDLFLLALERQDGIITDGTGRVASRLRELCQLGNSNSLTGTISETLRLMDETGLIRRQIDDKHTRTYSIELLRRLDEAEFAALADDETTTRSRLLGSSLASRLPEDTDPELVKLVERCSDGYAAIIHATRDDKVRQLGTLYALNVTGILRSRGIPVADIRRIKYYLRELGLAKADHAVDGDSQLWWWSVSTRTLKCDSLLHLATGPRSYENTRHGGSAAASGPVTVRRIEKSTGGADVTTGRPAADQQVSWPPHRGSTGRDTGDGRRHDHPPPRHHRRSGDQGDRKGRHYRRSGGQGHGKGRHHRRPRTPARRPARGRRSRRQRDRQVRQRVRGVRTTRPAPGGDFGRRGGHPSEYDRRRHALRERYFLYQPFMLFRKKCRCTGYDHR